MNNTNKKTSFFSTMLVLVFCFNTYAQIRSSKSNEQNHFFSKNSSKVLASTAAINETAISCGPFTWPLTGQTFTTSGTFTSNGITQSFNSLTAWNTNVTNFNATIASNALGGIPNTNPIPLTLGATLVSMSAPGGMFTSATFVGSNVASDVLTITFSPGVYGFGANIFPTNSTGTVVTSDITVTYSTGFVDTRTVGSSSEYFGYTSATPITSLTITCANSGSPFKFANLNNLKLATNPLVTLDLTVQTPPITADYSVCQGATVSGGLVSNLNHVIALPNFSGNTTGAPTYNRPQAMNQGGTCTNSGVGTAVPFSSHTFTAPTSGAYEFSSCGGATFDTFLALYEGTFNPSGLCAGNTLIESSDDVCGAQSTITCNLVVGTSYTLVFSGFGNTDAGAYTVTSTTPGATAVVPVPNFIGNTIGAPTYNRPQVMNQGGTCANSGVGTAVPFSSHTFIAPISGAYEFSSCGGATFDTFLALYEGTFNPTGLCAGNTLVESSDDVCGAQSTITCNLVGGTLYTLVFSGFGNTDSGPYTITSTTPGLLALVEWYTAPTGGTMIGSGSPFNPVGVTGSGLANTNTVGTTTFYSQFPGEICRTAADFIVVAPIVPTFNPITPICFGESLPALPTTSNNGIVGSWSPALNTTSTTNYTFTPNSDQCGTTTGLTITVNPISTTPTGNAVQTISVSNVNDATIADLVVSPTTIIWYPTFSDAQAQTNAMSVSTVLTSGSSYFAVNNSGTCPSLPFEVTATVTLGITDFEDSRFSYFPNPTTSVLNINSSYTISAIRVFNLLGQEIKHQNFNSNTLQIDLSDLPDGTFLVKIDFNGKEKTIKVIKK